MPGVPQPLVDNMQIVGPNGSPTQYFIRWAQQRQIDIAASIDAAQALVIVQQFLSDHPLHAGSGIGLAPASGDIGADITITAKVQEILDQVSTARGTILYRGAAGWAGLAPGTSGRFLETLGAGADPQWADALPDTAIVPGTYGDASHVAQVTFDQKGRATGAVNVTITAAGVGAVPSSRTIGTGTGLAGGGDLSANRVLVLADTAVTPGVYGDATHVPQITVDAQGRITNVTLVAISGGGATTPAVVRASKIQSFASNSSFNVVLPTGSLAGDMCWIMACGAWPMNTPTGWTSVQNETGSNVNFNMFTKVLSSTDISNGFVTCTAGGAFETCFGVVTWVGNPAGGITSPVQYVRNAGGPATTTISAALNAQDTAVYFAYMRANGTVSINWGAAMGSSPVAASNASGAMTSETVTSATTRSVVASYGVSATGVVQIVAVMKGT